MSTQIEWYEVYHQSISGLEIGAAGFLGSQAVAIASYFDDRDLNRDGRVSLEERMLSFVSPVRLSGANIVRVASGAWDQYHAIDSCGLMELRNRTFIKLASNLWLDGIFSAYVGKLAKIPGARLAKGMTDHEIAQLVIRKTFESTLKRIIEETVQIKN